MQNDRDEKKMINPIKNVGKEKNPGSKETRAPFVSFLSMPGKSEELGNLVPEKFSHLERYFSVPNTEIHRK